MSGFLSIAANGVTASAARYGASAAAVVKAATPGSDDDLAVAIVNTTEAAQSLKANILMLRDADKMVGTLFDALA